MGTQHTPNEAMQRGVKATLLVCWLIVTLDLVTVMSVWMGRQQLVEQARQQQAQIAGLHQAIAALEAAQAPTQPLPRPQGSQP